MAWGDIHFVVPKKIGDAFCIANAMLPGRAGGVVSLKEALLDTPVIDEMDVEALPHHGPFVGRSQLFGFSTSNLKCVVVHPWVEGVGQGVGHYRYLSPRIAVDVAAKKFIDGPDDFKPVARVDVFALLITGSSFSDMHKKLMLFLSVFSEATTYMCARRCQQLAVLETQKQALPDAAINSRWHQVTESSHARWNSYTGSVGNAFAFVDGFDCAEDSAEEDCAVLALKKGDVMAEALGNAQAAVNSISGGIGKKLFIYDTTPALAAQALRESDVGAEAPISVCIVFTGSVDSLNDLKDLF